MKKILNVVSEPLLLPPLLPVLFSEVKRRSCLVLVQVAVLSKGHFTSPSTFLETASPTHHHRGTGYLALYNGMVHALFERQGHGVGAEE